MPNNLKDEIEKKKEALRIVQRGLQQKSLSMAGATPPIDHEPRRSKSPAAEPNYDHWGQLSSWEIDEAVALALEIPPEEAKSAAFRNSRSSVAARYKQLLKRACRAVEDKHLSATESPPYRVDPGTFLGWLRRIGIPRPRALDQQVSRAWLTAHPGPRDADDPKAEIEQKDLAIAGLKKENLRLSAQVTEMKKDGDLNPKRKTSLLKMIYGLAKGKPYHWAPESGSPGTSRIIEQLRLAGVPIDPKTVREILAEADVAAKNAQTDI